MPGIQRVGAGEAMKNARAANGGAGAVNLPLGLAARFNSLAIAPHGVTPAPMAAAFRADFSLGTRGDWHRKSRDA
jgi:hypothetical protein